MSRVRASVGQGALEGIVKNTKKGFAYKAFLGIPFAKPPVGDLRFRDPVPAENWYGVFNATTEPSICAQFERLFKKAYVGVEDCLYLNVYVPDSVDINSNEKLPVMFWVHGGAFINGNCNGDLFGPDHLVEHNVILVTTNYRLGPLGFLSLDIPEAPGNVGLKDQALALKWVHDNIHNFGGDVDNVTIFGESAGGASIHFLMLTDLTKGMFKKAILQSGTSINEWAVQRSNIKNAFQLGSLLGIQTEDKTELLNHLLNIPVQDLVMASYSKTLGDNPLLPAFVPVIEKKLPSTSTFLDEEPRVSMKQFGKNDLTLMIGCCSHEGYMGLLGLVDILPQLIAGNVKLEALVPDFKLFVPSHLRMKYSEDKTNEAARRIKEFYFPNEENLLDKFLDLTTDLAFIKDIDHASKTYAKQHKTFYYKFGFKGNLNIFQLFFPLPYKGASHGDELAYIFQPRFEDLTTGPIPVATERELLVIKRMTEMWTNFAKYGHPTPTLTSAVTELWEPITGDSVNCLVIDDDLSLIQNPFPERMKFWDELEHNLLFG